MKIKNYENRKHIKMKTKNKHVVYDLLVKFIFFGKVTSYVLYVTS